MKLWTVFAVTPNHENWEMHDDGKIEIFDDELTEDFQVGVFDSPEAAEKNLAEWLPTYKLDPEAEGELRSPILSVHLWCCNLNEGNAKGEYVKAMREGMEYPYK